MGGKKNKGNKGGNNNNAPNDNEGGQEQFKFDFSGNGKKVGFDLGAPDSGLLSMVQAKMNSLVGQSSGYLESLPESVQNRIRVLRGLNAKKLEISKQYKAELAALDEKFRKLETPLYERRKEIVTGSKDFTEEELKNAPALINAPADDEDEKTDKKEEVKTEVKTEEKKEEEKDDVTGIPNFWTEVLKHHGDFAEMITKEDEKALKYLIDIRSRPLNQEGYSQESFVIEFEFKPENPYFNQTVLTKSYFLTEDEQLGETEYEKTEGTDIEWKEGKNLTVKLVKVQTGGGKKGRGGRGGRKGGKQGGKVVTVEEPCPSFFNIFSADIASAFGINEEDQDEMGPAELQELYEVDYETAVSLKQTVIPYALLWFTGELEAPFGDFDDEGYYDEEGEDDDEDDDDDDEAPARGQASGNKQQECNQQ
jgi:nucleosome assembly protein 1-like 1